MKPGAGKRKGNQFERIVYKKLRDVFGPETKRTLGSGSSDEPADTNTFKYNFECKFYKKISTTMLNQWWKKLLEDSKKNDNEPVLIFKENFEDIKVMEYYEDTTHIVNFEDWLRLEAEFKSGSDYMKKR